MNSSRKVYDYFLSKSMKTITADEIAKFSGKTLSAARKNIAYLVRNGLAVSVTKNFYVLLSPTEKEQKSSSPQNFISQLMEYKKINYYIGLLSAASFYGATHYRPMSFQVVTGKQIQFSKNFQDVFQTHTIKNFPQTCISKVLGKWGHLNYSSPALTIYDLIKFEQHVGTMANIIVIIQELEKELKVSDFKALLQNKVELSIIQKMGYLFERLGFNALTKPLEKFCSNAYQYIHLSKLNSDKGVKNNVWHINDNFHWEDLEKL